MTVVSNSSPLITLARIGRLELLPALYKTITITPQVYAEVAIEGASVPGSREIADAKWVDVRPVKNEGDLRVTQARFALGIGELSAIVLARELPADLLLMDDAKARKLARQEGVPLLGCVGVLEYAFAHKLLPDLGHAYRQLIAAGAYLNRSILESSLRSLNFPPL